MKIRQTVALSLALAMVAACTHASAAVVASTSFEEPGTAAFTTSNAGFGTAVGLTYVGGSELGFATSWTDTRSTGAGGPVDGSESGDFLGVTDFTGTVGAFTDGTQGYQWNDTDGAMTLTLDAVSLAGFTGAELVFDLFVDSTGWESDDSFGVTVNGSSVFATGADIDLDNPGLEGVWTTITSDISTFDGSSVTVAFTGDSNSGSENFYIDNVSINASPVPSPTGIGALASLAFSGLVVVRRRRRA